MHLLLSVNFISGALSSEKLTLVLCGSDASLTSSVAQRILCSTVLGEQTEQSQQPPDAARFSSPSMKREGIVCGHHVTLILLPPLDRCEVSEEDLWRETLRCLRLSDPGVDAFLIISEGHQTDEDKSALRRIEHFFGEEVGVFCLTVITGKSEQHRPDTFQRSDFILDSHWKVKPLLERIIKMGKDNRSIYTYDMYSSAQMKNHLRCHSDLEEMKMKVSALERENSELKGSKPGKSAYSAVLSQVLFFS